MNTTFEKYLDTIDKCLKPLPTSERVDIVKEIKGSILEMESDIRYKIKRNINLQSVHFCRKYML